MYKIFYLFFVIILFLSKLNTSFGMELLPEDVFGDIKSDYKYYTELKTLLNKWIVKQNIKFETTKLITKKEFIWYMVESNYKHCLSWSVDQELIAKNYTWSFSDIPKTDDYFYCVEYANENKYFTPYEDWHICEVKDSNWNDIISKFCPNDKLSMEDAIKVALNSSKIYSENEANIISNLISSWEKIFPELSTDVKPKNLDWTVYNYFPYFNKANDYTLIKIDWNWNEKDYKFFSINWWKIEPKRELNKEDLIRIAYIVSDLNTNFTDSNDDLSLIKDCSLDKDIDWINDCLDICINIKWSSLNNWCPILEKFCDSKCLCSTWYICSEKDEKTCSTTWICIPEDNLPTYECLYKNTNVILSWNAICDTCPCDNYLDFKSDLRKCDLVFSAITSPDKSEIYWKWDFWEIKN